MSDRRPLVVVAQEASAARARVAALLVEEGFRVALADDGHQAVTALAGRPAVLVIDAAIAGLLSFQVIERARRSAPDVRILLVASAFRPSAFQRRPSTLHGADDYLDEHEVEAELCAKVRALAEAGRPR